MYCLGTLLPFSLYHSRWERICSKDIDAALSIEKASINKGAEFKYGVYSEAGNLPIKYEGVENNELSDGQKYILKFIKTCEENAITPVLLYTPYCVLNNKDLVNPILSNNSITYIDLYSKSNEFLNYRTDFADRAHLNFLGTHKNTTEFGKQISQLIDFDTKADELWNGYYNNYINDRITTIEKCDQLMDTLLCMCDSFVSADITVGSRVCDNEIYFDLISEISRYDNVDIYTDDMNQSSVYFHITIGDKIIDKTFNVW